MSDAGNIPGVRAEGAPDEGVPFAHDVASLDAVETWNLLARQGRDQQP